MARLWRWPLVWGGAMASPAPPPPPRLAPGHHHHLRWSRFAPAPRRLGRHAPTLAHRWPCRGTLATAPPPPAAGPPPPRMRPRLPPPIAGASRATGQPPRHAPCPSTRSRWPPPRARQPLAMRRHRRGRPGMTL